MSIPGQVMTGRAAAAGRDLAAPGRISRRLAMLSCAVLLSAAAPAAATPGRAETSFGSAGTASSPANTSLSASGVQPDGKVVVAGSSTAGGGTDVFLERFTAGGAPDPTFGHNGVVVGPSVPGATTPSGQAVSASVGRALAIQPDGKIVVVGKSTTTDGSLRGGILIERYDANGSLDTSFGQGGIVNLLASSNADGYSVALQPNGAILAGGSSDAFGSSNGDYPRAVVARLTPSGGLDTTFGSGGTDVIDLGAYSYAYALAVQIDGKIVLAGSQSPNLQSVNSMIARITPTGSLDPSFAGGGAFAASYSKGGASSAFSSLALQPNGSILAAGAALDGNTGADAFVVRFTTAGGQDPAFGSGGVASTPSASGYNSGNSGPIPGAAGVVVIANGDVVLAGTATSGLQTYGALWAFTSAGAPDARFGSGGATVISDPSGKDLAEAGITMSPDSSFVTAGTASAFGAPSTGEASRFAGFETPVPTPTPTPTPKPPAFKITLRGASGSYSVSSLRSKGIPVTVACTTACKLTLTLSVSAAQARKLGLKVRGSKPVTLVRVGAKLTAKGSKKLTLHLSAGLLREIQKLKRVAGSIQLVGTPGAGGRSSTITKSTSLHR